jgi:lysozyme family protein
MPTGSKEKTAAGKLKNWGTGKDSPEVARNKMIQRTLGVKVDGIMGTKSMAAWGHETNRLVLDLPTKTLTELEESKPLLQLMQGIKKCLLRLWH